MITIELKNEPGLKQLLNRALPGYRKHKCFVSVFRPTNINSYWDGGSRDEFTLIHLGSMEKRELPTYTHPYFDVARYGIQGENDMVSVDSRGNVTLKAIPAGWALIRSGYFCGKPATAEIMVHPDNMPRCLEPAPKELTEA